MPRHQVVEDLLLRRPQARVDVEREDAVLVAAAVDGQARARVTVPQRSGGSV